MAHEYVKLEKLQQVSETETLAVGYWIKGLLFQDVQVGKPVLVERYVRNGEKVLGVMNTSIVQSIEPQGNGVLLLHTMNSIYRLEFLDEKEMEEDLKELKINVAHADV